LKHLITIILLFSSFKSFCQLQETLLYNSSGQLKLDTSYSITQEQLIKWRSVEDLLIERIIQEVKYSPIARENELIGCSIVCFEVDSIGHLQNFRKIKTIGGGLEEIVLNTLKTFQFLQALIAPNSMSSPYYLPINFNLINSRKYIKDNNAIPIFDVHFEYIQK